jgi:hypothetical protein
VEEAVLVAVKFEDGVV